jgi:flavorubredoxin
MTTETSPRLPRELAPGVFWLGACEHFPFKGEIIHSGDSQFLIVGDEASLLVEAGLPNDHRVILEQLDSLLEGKPELRTIWPTHQETPHAGGIGRLLSRYPNATVRGNVQDYHLFFPEFAARFTPMEPGEEIDLGGTRFVALRPVIRDLITTQWGFDTRSRTIFTGDGFAYAHHHAADQCGRLAEEVSELDIPDMTGLFTDQSLTWARYTEMEPYAERLSRLIDELDVQVVAPTHGLPAADVPAIMPRILAGLTAAGGVGERYQGRSG